MVAYDMDFDDLNTPKKSIDDLIDKYGPPADLGVTEAQKIQQAHYGVITAVIFQSLSGSDNPDAAWLSLRLNRDVRKPAQQILGETFARWSFYQQA